MTIFAEIDLLLYPRCARIQLDLAKARQMTSSARSARRGGDIVEWLICYRLAVLTTSRGTWLKVCKQNPAPKLRQEGKSGLVTFSDKKVKVKDRIAV